MSKHCSRDNSGLQVGLAGYNIDSSLIAGIAGDNATPEVLAAAYARISRSPKSVNELRQEALLELEKARRSNTRIIFELGHASVAEHAVFNFDIIGVSRLLTETLETVRLASFTEKSQRYVTFDPDFYCPPELDASSLKNLKSEYLSTVADLFKEYHASYQALAELYQQQYPQQNRVQRECMAKEDARYILPLAAKTQLGMTINARSLENLLRRLAANPLNEAQDLHAKLLEPVKALCPSLVRYTDKETYAGGFAAPKLPVDEDDPDPGEAVRLVDMSQDPDTTILAALLYEQSASDFEHCRQKVKAMAPKDQQALWTQVFSGMQSWHKVHRAFELADFSFELRMSESCWAQFKRHRMATMIRQPYPSSVHHTIPEAILTLGRDNAWDALVDRLENLAQGLRKVACDLSPYVRINASQVKVLAKMNLRELYHFVRLRSDEHAQWEIRQLSQELAGCIKVKSPQAAALLCGKSELQALLSQDE